VRPARSEVMRLHADASLAARVLGWSSATTLEAGLRETVEWVNANRDLYRPGTYEV
jgi:nucleoside-diphosphate-sugar epimerase